MILNSLSRGASLGQGINQKSNYLICNTENRKDI